MRLTSRVLLLACAPAAYSWHGLALPLGAERGSSGRGQHDAWMCAHDRPDRDVSGEKQQGWPSPSLTPIEVVEAQLAALQVGNVEGCYRFASPENKRAVGSIEQFDAMLRRTPAYAPLLGATRSAVVAALAVGERGYRCRVRVWPGPTWRLYAAAGSDATPLIPPVLDYDWRLTRQADDEIDYGIAGSWLVDGVIPDAVSRTAWDAARGEIGDSQDRE
jgi:hypothetical protein